MKPLVFVQKSTQGLPRYYTFEPQSRQQWIFSFPDKLAVESGAAGWKLNASTFWLKEYYNNIKKLF